MIPADICEFILEHINSIAELEALLLLSRDDRQEWDVPGLAQRLYITEAEVERVVSQLAGQNLIEKTRGFYRFSRSSDTQTLVVERLGQLYATRLIPITSLVHSKSSSRIQAFADAFVLKKGK